MELTDAEREFIEIVRGMDKRADYKIVIEINDGVWDVMMWKIGANRIIRGKGATFSAAWSDTGRVF
jgi:hypothetical protein